MYLRSQGVPTLNIIQMTEKQFGRPKTAQEVAEQQAKDQQMSSIAKTGGNLAGQWAATKLPSLFGGGAAGAGTTAATSAGTAGTVGATGGGLAGVGTASGVGGAASAGGLGTIGSAALPVAVGAALLSNAYETGGKDILRGKGDSADWTNQGINMLLPGANIAARLLGGKSIGERMKSGKSEAQQIRDDFRGFLKSEGVADDNYQVTLADGSKFDIGKDGKAKLQNVDNQTDRKYYEIDWQNPLAKKAVEMIDPKVRENFQDGKQQEQFTAMLVNAATSNAKTPEEVQANINAMLGQSKLAGGTMNPKTLPIQVTRPKKGEVIRVSPGMYRTDTGELMAGPTKRHILERAYGRNK